MRFLRRAVAGAVAGTLGGVGVALFFLVEGAVHLQPFSVPVRLASGLLGWSSFGLDTPLGADLASFGVLGEEVLVYTVIHLVTFAVLGAIAAFLLEVRSFWKSLWGGVVYGGIVCTGVLYASRWMAVTPVTLHDLGVRSVIFANAMAGAILGVGLHLVRVGYRGGSTPRGDARE